jgi:anti-sigma B factor antagonist
LPTRDLLSSSPLRRSPVYVAHLFRAFGVPDGFAGRGEAFERRTGLRQSRGVGRNVRNLGSEDPSYIRKLESSPGVPPWSSGARRIWDRIGRTSPVMQLKVQNARFGNVVVIRCDGRIVAGDEVQALQIEVDKLMLETKQVVLNLAQVNFLDSGGLGALVRFTRVLRRHRGDMVLCHLTPFVLQVLEATTLHRFFQTCPSETEAVRSFSLRSPVSPAAIPEPLARVVCAHKSTDVLAFMSALLGHAGFEVFTATTLADARTLVVATHPIVFVHGAEMGSNEISLARIRQLDPQRPFLQLPADFSSAEASQSGAQLVDRIRSLLRP